MQTKSFCLMKKINVDFKSFVIRVKRISEEVFEPSSVQSQQFQTLAPLTLFVPLYFYTLFVPGYFHPIFTPYLKTVW